VASRTQYKFERVFALALAVLPAVWIWLDDVPWWFHNMSPDYYWPTHILAHLGLPERYLPDLVYVIFACTLMCLSLTYVVLTFTKWPKQPELKVDS
jgi:hypothetical protein